MNSLSPAALSILFTRVRFAAAATRLGWRGFILHVIYVLAILPFTDYFIRGRLLYIGIARQDRRMRRCSPPALFAFTAARIHAVISLYFEKWHADYRSCRRAYADAKKALIDAGDDAGEFNA